jgi:pyridoxamine 5'-phosphate oxidase-like protein
LSYPPGTVYGMASWSEFSAEAPALADAVRQRLDARRHKVLATLRPDGSPRVSGIEATINGGELWLAGMVGSVKFADLRRDTRMALHSGTEDPADQPPAGEVIDAKVGGRAREVTDPEVVARFAAQSAAQQFHLFRVDITDAALVRIGDPPDHLVIESWREGRGQRRAERR